LTYGFKVNKQLVTNENIHEYSSMFLLKNIAYFSYYYKNLLNDEIIKRLEDGILIEIEPCDGYILK
jgi:hypothetical protein